MRGGRGYSRGGGPTSYGRGGSSGYRGNDRRNMGDRDRDRSSSRYEEHDRSRPGSGFKRPSTYGNGSDRYVDDRKRSRYEGGSPRGGSSSRRGGHESSFRSSSSRDYGNSSGAPRYESHRSSNSGARRPSPVHHHHQHHHSSSNHHRSGGGRTSPGPSSYRESGGGRTRRDSEPMGPPVKRLSAPRTLTRGRGRFGTSLGVRGRGTGLRLGTSIRGRVGRVEGRPMTALRKRILTTSAKRNDLMSYKALKMRSLAIKRMSAKKDAEGEDDEDNEEDEEEEDAEDETAAMDEEKTNGGSVKEEPLDEDEPKEAAGGDTAAKKDEKKTATATEGKAAAEKAATDEDGKAEAKKDAKADDAAKEEAKKSSSESPAKKPRETKSPIRFKSNFIKLSCPHCPKAVTRTFMDYSRHLNSDGHRQRLQRISLKLKHQLLKMRTAQREAQRETDQDEDSETRSAFCLLCRLNHRQSKAAHNASDGHKNMIKFQRPKCSICKVYFKSPFMYEQHRCSLEHLKLKSKADNLRTDDENSDAELERDLEHFTTVDSVGDVDEDGVADLMEKEANGADKEAKDGDEEDEAEDDDDINIGVEHVNKIEIYYCDLCRYYFPRRADIELRIKRHCQSRLHLHAYLEYKDEELLRQDAERLAAKRKKVNAKKAEKKPEGEKEGAVTTTTTEDVEIKQENGGESKEKAPPAGNVDVKEEVAKEDAEGKEGAQEHDGDELELTTADEDVNEMMDGANYEDDDDSRMNSERYDRFRYSGGGDEEEEATSPASAATKDSAA